MGGEAIGDGVDEITEETMPIFTATGGISSNTASI